jgi:hypothetical protein
MNTRILREPFIVTDSLRIRFTLKTATATSGCIEWTGASNPNGYGKVKISGQIMDAHVASWRIANGGNPVPVGQLIMHSCDNRKCVNPDHLSCGTSSDNMVDCRDKNRLYVARGESVHNAVLTESIVRDIRDAWRQPGMSQRKVAARFGLKYSVVRAALEGRSWKHVTSEAVR